MIRLSMRGSSDYEEWERIWEDASVVTARCIRAGKQGSVGSLGMGGPSNVRA